MNTLYNRTTTSTRPTAALQPSQAQGCCSTFTNPDRIDGLVLSPQSRMMMDLMGMASQFRGGSLGEVTSQGSQRMDGADPGFGQSPGVRPGEVKEMQAGQTARGANGSRVTRGQDGTVTITYRDRRGRQRRLEVKDGLARLDGGRAVRLSNRGQLLKLPNGDVVAIGNAEMGGGRKKLSRVALADSASRVATDEAGKTNIFDVSLLERQEVQQQGGGISMQISGGSVATPFGVQSFMNANISAFAGRPVLQTVSEQRLNLVGSK